MMIYIEEIDYRFYVINIINMITKKPLHFKNIQFNNCYDLIFTKSPNRYFKQPSSHPQQHNPIHQHRYSNPNIKHITSPSIKEQVTAHKVVKSHKKKCLNHLQKVSINGINFQGFLNNRSWRKSQQLNRNYRQNLKTEGKIKTLGGFHFFPHSSFSKFIDTEQPAVEQFYNKLSLLTKRREPNPQIVQKYLIKRRALTENQQQTVKCNKIIENGLMQRKIRFGSMTSTIKKRDKIVNKKEGKIEQIEPWQIFSGQDGNLLINQQ